MEREIRTRLTLTHGRKTPDLDWLIVDLQVHGTVLFLKAVGNSLKSRNVIVVSSEQAAPSLQSKQHCNTIFATPS